MFRTKQMEPIYEVELFETFSLTYNENGTFSKEKDNVQNAKFYSKPNDRVEKEGRKGTIHNCKTDGSLQKYGFVERVKEINEEKRVYNIIKRHEFKEHEEWEKMRAKLISSHYERKNYPQVFSNLSCLVAMMVPSKWHEFQARRMDINNGNGDYVIRVKLQSSSTSKKDNSSQYHSDSCSYGLIFEHQTQFNGASSEETTKERNQIEPINMNKILQTFYGATLNIDDETLRFAFFAETDGLWKTWSGATTSKPSIDVPKPSDIVEVKSIDKTNLTSRTGLPTSFYFEEKKMRDFYAGCAIRGIPHFICNVVENEKLKEQWLYSVEKMPAVVETCSKKKEWNRAFPKNVSNKIGDGKLKIWNREDCFRSLGSDLRKIISIVMESEKSNYRFCRDNHNEIIEVNISQEDMKE